MAYRNGTMYSCYTAASVAREYELAEQRGVNFQGALTWAFEFENQPFFAGFRSLASNGIDKPVLNVFRMFSLMGGQRLDVTSSHGLLLADILRHGVRGQADISALATLGTNELCVMAWHYHDDDLPAPDMPVEVTVAGLTTTKPVKVQHFRIDHDHSNAFAAWQKMGSPQQPSPAQYAELEAAGGLQELAPPQTMAVNDGNLLLKFSLPRQAVSLLKLTW